LASYSLPSSNFSSSVFFFFGGGAGAGVDELEEKKMKIFGCKFDIFLNIPFFPFLFSVEKAL